MGAQSDPIRHVVHLILENRSFDQMLGALTVVHPELDGVDAAAPAKNADPSGRTYVQEPTKIRQMLKWDPRHEVQNVAVQLENDNSGFVKNFAEQYPDSTTEARQLIMSYYPLDFLPALHALGRQFTVCDRWFASVPGPTWPNRFFALSGTSNGRVNMPSDGTHKADLPGYFQQTQTTLFDRLNEAAVHWKIYFHDIPQTTVLTSQRQPHNVARYFYIDQFYIDARGLESDFPSYCLIEPDFMGYGQNDGHPPHDIMRSEKLIADVYNALRANDALWTSTLFIVTFDEHGGFFDHVPPPAAVPPDDAQPSEYTFDRLGVRVPTVLASRWIKPGVVHTVFDHTSVLKYLTGKWSLGPLGRRTAAANSIASVIGNAQFECDLKRIELSPSQLLPPDPHAEEEAFGLSSDHQSALAKLAEWLMIESDEKAPRLAVALAKIAAWVEARAERLIFGQSRFNVSIAQPDKLSLPLQTVASDNVAKFMMRVKRYAAQGIQNRLSESLPAQQQSHSLQTLAGMTGRAFHKERAEDKVETAKAWLARQDSAGQA